MNHETYFDDENVERCDNTDQPAGECGCTCDTCGDGPEDCACENDEPPTGHQPESETR